MTIRKESKQYIRQQRKIDADLVKRPNEILKRTTDDGNLKLTFKSPTYYEKDIVVTKNAMLSNTPLIKSYKPLESLESFILDLEGQKIITYNLTQNTTITDVVNYNNGMSYKLYLKQDEVGGKSFVFDETISNITLFDNFQIDQTPNSITQIKIDVVEDTLYVQSYVDYKKNLYPFVFTIDTTLGTGSSFDLPLRQYRKDFETDQYTIANDYNMLVDWGDGSSDVITSYNQAEKNHTYISGGTYEIKVTGLCESWGFRNEQIDEYVSTDYNKLTNVIEWGYIGIIDASLMFDSCENINELNGGDIWCKNVNNMDYIAYGLTNLNIPNWDISNVINVNEIFQYSDSIINLNISNWDVSNITNMSQMFIGCSSLETLDVSNWDVSNVTTMYSIFQSCSSLTLLDVSNWDVSNVTNMNSMFNGCSSLTTLDVSNWDVSNVTDMQSMFSRCQSLTTLDVSNWDVSNVNSMGGMFAITPLNTPSYDALLIGWSGLPSLQSNVNLRLPLTKYSSGAAATAKQYIIDTYGWTISDDGQVI